MSKLVVMPYSAEMIRAKIAGRKTHTRRVITSTHIPAVQESLSAALDFEDLGDGRWRISGDAPTNYGGQVQMNDWSFTIKSPRGKAGDIQYWQEAFDFSLTNFPMIRYKADGEIRPLKLNLHEAELFNAWRKPKVGEWRGMPAMFMLPSMSRGRDKILEVRIERIQDISREDAIAEGLERSKGHDLPAFLDCNWTGNSGQTWHTDPRDAYRKLWDSINAARGYSWDSNPWVWVYVTEKAI